MKYLATIELEIEPHLPDADLEYVRDGILVDATQALLSVASVSSVCKLVKKPTVAEVLECEEHIITTRAIIGEGMFFQAECKTHKWLAPVSRQRRSQARRDFEQHQQEVSTQP